MTLPTCPVVQMTCLEYEKDELSEHVSVVEEGATPKKHKIKSSNGKFRVRAREELSGSCNDLQLKSNLGDVGAVRAGGAPATQTRRARRRVSAGHRLLVNELEQREAPRASESICACMVAFLESDKFSGSSRLGIRENN